MLSCNNFSSNTIDKSPFIICTNLYSLRSTTDSTVVSIFLRRNEYKYESVELFEVEDFKKIAIGGKTWITHSVRCIMYIALQENTNLFPVQMNLIPSPIRTFFMYYCDNSNIHGLRYINERSLHWSKRLTFDIKIYFHTIFSFYRLNQNLVDCFCCDITRPMRINDEQCLERMASESSDNCSKWEKGNNYGNSISNRCNLLRN